MAKKKKRKGNFRGKVARDTERQQSARSSYGYLNLPRGVNMFSPEPGSRVKLDILPYEVTDNAHPDRYEEEAIAVPGELWYKRPFKVHRDIGAGKDAVICPTSFGKRCPICEYRSKRLKEGADKEETGALKPSMRNLYVVIPKGSKSHEEKPHILDISQYLFQNLLNQELQEDEDNTVFPDLEEGKTLKIRFDSQTIGKSKPFAEASRIDFLDRKEQYDESILKEVPNLDEVLNLLSYKEIEALFMELDPEDMAEDEDEVEETTSRKKKKGGKKSKSEPEEEDDEDFDDDMDEEDGLEEEEEEELDEEDEYEDEEDDFDEDDEDEDEEDDDDFDEDEDDEEEDEEPEPPVRKKPKRKTRK